MMPRDGRQTGLLPVLASLRSRPSALLAVAMFALGIAWIMLRSSEPGTTSTAMSPT
jgi:hypothetical protein